MTECGRSTLVITARGKAALITYVILGSRLQSMRPPRASYKSRHMPGFCGAFSLECLRIYVSTPGESMGDDDCFI